MSSVATELFTTPGVLHLYERHRICYSCLPCHFNLLLQLYGQISVVVKHYLCFAILYVSACVLMFVYIMMCNLHWLFLYTDVNQCLLAVLYLVTSTYQVLQHTFVIMTFNAGCSIVVIWGGELYIFSIWSTSVDTEQAPLAQ